MDSFKPINTHLSANSIAYTPSAFPYVISPYYNSDYVNFLANVSSDYEPNTYNQAEKDSRWTEAMRHELEALERNKTWEIV